MTQNSHVSRSNGDWRVLMYHDGTKVMFSTHPDPKPDYPESIEVGITHVCQIGCSVCYADAHSNASHAKTEDFLPLLLEMPEHIEIALGGGNPVSHPEFSLIVSRLSERFWVTTSINQHVPRDQVLLCASLPLAGIGVSVIGDEINTEPFRILSEHKKQVTAHVIVGCTQWATVLDIFKLTPRVLLLGYKAKGRGKANIPYAEIKQWRKNFRKYLATIPNEALLGFDNLAIYQLRLQDLLPRETFDLIYLGEEGTLTMFYDAVDDQYGPSSIHKTKQREGKSLVECFHTFRRNPSEWESEEWRISKEL